MMHSFVDRSIDRSKPSTSARDIRLPVPLASYLCGDWSAQCLFSSSSAAAAAAAAAAAGIVVSAAFHLHGKCAQADRQTDD